jgi:uncharacterized membrane protein YqiK
MSAPAIVFTVLIIVAIAFLLAWLLYSQRYQKASKEIAFIRTGFGGQKVLMNGGALVIPTLHEIIQVNMNTMRLEIRRDNNQSLVTKDRLRMDVQAEFYIRVKPTMEDIVTAAQTLGRRTMNSDALKSLVEGKFINALRVVAAEMNMDELHQNRGKFVQRVQEALGDGLVKNGLELESVSLSELNQTDKKYFNPQNAFDAQGLTLLTETIQDRAKQRNAIERDTEVAIKKKDLEARRQKLEIAKEEEFATLEQQRDIEVRRADQQTHIAKEQVTQERLSRETELAAKEQVELAQLNVERTLEEKRIEKEHLIREKSIESERELEIAQIQKDQQTQDASIIAQQKLDQARLATERALEEERIAKDQALKASELSKSMVVEKAEVEKEKELREAKLDADRQLEQLKLAKEKDLEVERISREFHIKQQRIDRDTAIETAEIQRQKTVETADLERAMALAEAGKQHVRIQVEVDQIRSDAVKAEEQIVTARQVEVARRENTLAAFEARRSVESESIALLEMAEAKKKAAVCQAETEKTIALGQAVKIKHLAEADAEAELIKTKSSKQKYLVDAEGARLLNEAENALDPQKSATRIKMNVIDHMAEIIQASVKPMESIDGIKIIQVDGLHPNGGASSQGTGSGTDGGNLGDQLINSALRYRGQAPLVDAILKEVGIAGGDLEGFSKTLQMDEKQTPGEDEKD